MGSPGSPPVVRARPGQLSALTPLAFPTVNRFCTALLYGRAGRLTAPNGGFRPRAVVLGAVLVVQLAVRSAIGPWRHSPAAGRST
jgi:hypothetical protein